MEPQATVYVVDDDAAMRVSLQRLMESVGLPVETFPSAEAYLESYDPAQPGCLLLDIRMSGMSGLELQDKLAVARQRIPVIIISAHGDVEQAVQAMRTGAIDFIRKPYKGQVLLDRIRQALEQDARIRREEAERADVAARLARLTSREREVMNLLVAGRTSKQIALEFGLSRKTVDIHRSHVMSKLQAHSVVDLVRMAQICQATETPAARPANGP